MTSTAPQAGHGRRRYAVRLTIQATGESSAEAVQDALRQILQDGLTNASPSVEKLIDDLDEDAADRAPDRDLRRADPTSALVGRSDRTRSLDAVGIGVPPEFHGNFLG